MKKVLPPGYFFLAIMFMAAFHLLIPGRRIIAFPWNLPGLLPLLSGIALDIIADRRFKRDSTTVKPHEESAVLVVDGPFRLSRNPMYLGMVLILAGVAGLMGSLTPWLVVPAFAVLLDVIFIRAEERMLEEGFGDAYREYRKRVRRWI